MTVPELREAVAARLRGPCGTDAELVASVRRVGARPCAAASTTAGEAVFWIPPMKLELPKASSLGMKLSRVWGRPDGISGGSVPGILSLIHI